MRVSVYLKDAGKLVSWTGWRLALVHGHIQYTVCQELGSEDLSSWNFQRHPFGINMFLLSFTESAPISPIFTQSLESLLTRSLKKHSRALTHALTTAVDNRSNQPAGQPATHATRIIDATTSTPLTSESAFPSHRHHHRPNSASRWIVPEDPHRGRKNAMFEPRGNACDAISAGPRRLWLVDLEPPLARWNGVTW